MLKHKHTKAARGISFMELLLVLFITAIFTSTGMSSIFQLSKGVTLARDTANWSQALKLARNMALSSRQRMVICGVDTNGNCMSFSDSGVHEAMLYRDENDNLKHDENELVALTWRWSIETTVKINKPIIYFVPFSVAGNSALSLYLCSGELGANKLVVSNQGRIRLVKRTHCSD
jgi:Tfp pilus assembly protein FimT